jgi:hypothetical protein
LGNFAAPHQGIISLCGKEFHFNILDIFVFNLLGRYRVCPERRFCCRGKKQHFPLKKSFLPLENIIFAYSIRLAVARARAQHISINF